MFSRLENFPRPETCKKLIDANKDPFEDSEFVYAEHLCGLDGDRTEYRIEARMGRESTGMDIISCPSIIEMLKYMDVKYSFGFLGLLNRAFFYDNPAGDYDKLADNLLIIVCGEIEKQENK